jgi:hypothetical protein
MRARCLRACARAIVSDMGKSVPLVPLLERHKKFADEYLRTRNATQSAVAAGCKSASAHVTGYKWLKRPDVTEYLRIRVAQLAAPKDEAAEQGKQLDDRVIQELSTLAFANIADLIVWTATANPALT